MFKKFKRNKIAFWLAMLSSLFLFISGTNGFATWVNIREIFFSIVGILPWIKILFIPVLIVASLGAFSVLFGGYLALKKKFRLGRIFILIGSGAGLVSFFFNLFVSFYLNLSLSFYLSFSSLGIICALLAQIFLIKKRKLGTKN